MDAAQGVPNRHGPLIEGLGFDFASLRPEVQRFFELLDNLGLQPGERQLSLLLSSGAVVVAAAMACEVARRQARRPVAGSAFALVANRELGTDTSVPLGLPNFGQFSAG